MRIRTALLVTSFLALPLLAQAQPVSGFYIGAGAGVNYLQETDVDVTGPVVAGTTRPQRTGQVEFDLGFVGVLSLGYGYGNGLRGEVEVAYRQNEVDTATGFTGLVRPLRTDGKARSYGVMANMLFDIDLGMGFVMPYVGGGLGWQWHEYDSVRARGTNGSATVDGEQGRFAYQGIAGLSFPISAAPGLAITAEYRFMGSLSPEIEARSTLNPGAAGNAEVDNYNHSLLLGLRYAFGAPPPPPVVAPAPAPAAAPAPARTYLVFFDFDRSDLTDRARQIIAEAASNAQRVGSTRIEVAGHADRSGTPQYNQALSMRRANAVAAELERRGIARGQMSIQAFGESRPLVPTADGVREPQNRRVEIVLR